MISPVSGHLAQYSNSVDMMKAIPASTDRPPSRSGRCSPGAVRRSVITLTGPVR